LKNTNFLKQINNGDEMDSSTVQNPGCILEPNRENVVGAAISWKRGKNITAVCSVGASGNYIPPTIIYAT
jgi:hypothetical protein